MEGGQEEEAEEERRVEGAGETIPNMCAFLFILMRPRLFVWLQLLLPLQSKKRGTAAFLRVCIDTACVGGGRGRDEGG